MTPASEDTEDIAWLRASAAGEREAFARLYRRHQPRLVQFLRRTVGRVELAEEIANDALWLVWRRAGAFRGESKVRTWITGIAYRCMLRAWRDGRPAAEMTASELGDFSFDSLPSATAEATVENRDWLGQGLAALPPEQRLTLELAYLMGESCEDIATIMGCAVGTVKARMFHARLRLRNTLPALAGLKAGDNGQEPRHG